MGVLKVNVGDAVTPDWRKVGCGTVLSASSIDDDFDRANSTTGLGTASDGGTWIEDSATTTDPIYGIISDAAYIEQFPDSNARARRNVGNAAADLQVTDFRSNTNGFSFLWLAYDPATDSGYAARYDAGGTFTVQRFVAGSSTQVGSGMSGSGWTGSSSVLRFTHDGAGSLSIYQGGVLLGTVVDSTPLTGTWAGFGASQAKSSTGETWNDFTCTGTAVAVPGRLKLWTGTEWVREVCDGDTPPFPTASNMASVWCAPTAPPHYFRAYSNGLPAATSIFHVQFLVGTGRQFNMSLLSGTPSGHAIWEATDTGSPVVSPGDTISSITCYDASINNLGTTTPSPSTVQTLVLPRPLKMWDGTSWVTVACMVSA